MIIQTTRINRAGGVHYLASHLLDKTDENELIEILAGDRDALHDAQALASARGCRYSVRHLSISPEREMTPMQLSAFLRSVDTEFRIGPDRPRLVVRHIKNGRSHFHLAVAEVDPGTLRVLDCKNDYRRLEDLARRYEVEQGETAQPARAERRRNRAEGFSDTARKRAERVAPSFDRTALRKSFVKGGAAFGAELDRQGLRLAEGEKGAVLVSAASGTFVSAACRATGVKRAEFQKFLQEENPNARHSRNPLRVPEHDRGDGAQHAKALAAPRAPGAARGARQDRATDGNSRAHSRRAAHTGNGAQEPRGKGRSSAASIARTRERLFLHRLTKLDLDDLLRRAMELAASIMVMLAPERDRLAWRIAEAKRTQRQFPPAERIEEQRPTYDLTRRIRP
ncbi:relaxase/mobilization nuclease domain-containing protein [Shinella zoogloeoides]